MIKRRDKTKILIFGAGGHGREVAAYINDLISKGYSLGLLGFIDDHKRAGIWGCSEILGDFGCLSGLKEIKKGEKVSYITAIGNNSERQKMVRRIEASGLNLRAWTLNHGSVMTFDDVEIGEGTCLAPGVIITSHVRIGSHCILNVKASVSHDCVVGDYVSINPGATICGGVMVGNGSVIGAGATVKEQVSIGEGTIVGAQAMVVDDLPAHVTAVGVPAKIIKSNMK